MSSGSGLSKPAVSAPWNCERCNVEKAYSIDAERVFGLRDNQQDPDAPDAVWVPIVSHEREECESPESKTDAIRWVTSKGTGAATSIDRSSGPFVDQGQRAPIGNANPSSSGVIGQDEYLAGIARDKFNRSKGETMRFVAFHRVRRADLY